MNVHLINEENPKGNGRPIKHCETFASAQILLLGPIGYYDIHGLVDPRIDLCDQIKDGAERIAASKLEFIRESARDDTNLANMETLRTVSQLIQSIDTQNNTGTMVADNAIRLIEARNLSELAKMYLKLAVALYLMGAWINEEEKKGLNSNATFNKAVANSVSETISTAIEQGHESCLSRSDEFAQMAISAAARLVFDVVAATQAVHMKGSI